MNRPQIKKIALTILLPLVISMNLHSYASAQEVDKLEDPIGNEKAEEALKNAGPQGTGISIKRNSAKLKLGSADVSSDVQDISGVQDVNFDSSGFGFKISLSGDYFFAYDKDDLLPEARESLAKIYALMEQYEAKSLSIIGHTDAHGPEEYNQTLSESRANSTKQWFIEKGLVADIIQTQGRGELEPIAPNTQTDGSDNPEGRAQNRRVDLEVTTLKKVNHVPVQQ